MRGFVPTPLEIVDRMVERLFSGRPVDGGVSVLDPGCGEGLFIEGILRWCSRHRRPIPRIVGVELHPERFRVAKRKFHKYSSIEIRHADFLVKNPEKFDYIVGNPPYVSIGHLSEMEKRDYRERYITARGRFDLYMLFFEQALRQLIDGGRLVFITPEKYLYVDTAKPLRRLLASHRIKELSFVREDAFDGVVAYPLITVVDNKQPSDTTRIRLRDGSTRATQMADTSGSWIGQLSNGQMASTDHVLADICIRVSCGIATGADAVYVRSRKDIVASLERFAYPTIAGRQLGDGKSLHTGDVMLVPYSRQGTLLAENDLGALSGLLGEKENRQKLSARTCSDRKPWYAFHDSAPLSDILRPKLLCKDITSRPRFWIDRDGSIVPRHSVYYVVPKNSEAIDELAEYLNSVEAAKWLSASCQRAANGFIRLQSNVLKRLPVPARLASLMSATSC